jgi:ABC-type amino acid transport system permease subunit
LGARARARRRPLQVTPALGAAIVNLGVGFVSVAIVTVLRRPFAATILLASGTPVLCVVTLFFALGDLTNRPRGDEGRLAAWLSLLLTLVPLLLLFIFFRIL